MTYRSTALTTIATLSYSLVSCPAEANVILPMFGWFGIGLFLLLIPVVVVEATILWWKAGTTFLFSLWSVGVANVLSTAVGMLANAASLRLIGAAFVERHRGVLEALHGDDTARERRDDITAFWLTFLVFLVASAAVETLVVADFSDGVALREVAWGMIAGNVVTYVAIGIGCSATVLRPVERERAKSTVAATSDARETSTPATTRHEEPRAPDSDQAA